MEKFKIYLKSIAIPVIVGIIVAIIIMPFMDYNSLVKPKFSPPSVLFPIVWTIMYILMGVSYGILREKKLITTEINNAYYFQLAVNAIWPILFFVFKWRFIAFLWIVLLCIAVINMIIKFYKASHIAGLIQIPYLLWCLYATYLNFGVYLLND